MNLGTAEPERPWPRSSRRENGLDYAPSEIMVTSGASEGPISRHRRRRREGRRGLDRRPRLRLLLGHRQGDPRAGGFRPHERRFHFTAEAVAERVTRGPHRQLPQQPHRLRPDEGGAWALAELAEDHDFALISDEVYEQFIYEGEHASPALYSETPSPSTPSPRPTP